MRTRFVIYVLVLAGLAFSQISFNKTSAPAGAQFQVAGSGPGSIMMPPSCRDPKCGEKLRVEVSIR